MTLRFFRRLYEPVQAHKALDAAWREVKPYLIAGHALELVIRPETRSGGQNALFHKLCGEAAKAGLAWAGKKRTEDQWKVLFISGHAVVTKEGAEVIPGLEGEFVNVRESSASMSRWRGSSLIEYTTAYLVGAGVRLPAPDDQTTTHP